MVTHNLEYYRKIQGLNNTGNRKEAEIRLIKNELAHDFYNSLDCESVTVNGVSTDLLITKSNDYTIKNVVTKPDEYVGMGDIINWCDTDWIIDTIDADDRINTHAKMRRCNVVLKWLDENGTIRAYSGFCEDATKYGEGISGGKMLQVPDFQVKVKIRLDPHSAKINRDRRFLLDASQYLSTMESSGVHPSAFIVTRRNVLTGSHDGSGYIELTLSECAFSARDNPDMMLADYYPQNEIYTLDIINSPEQLTMQTGQVYPLVCIATKNGEAVSSDCISFKSSDTLIATISATGEIAAVGIGFCQITATIENAKATLEILVSESIEDYEIRIEPDSGDYRIAIGTSKDVAISIYSGSTKLLYELHSSLVGAFYFATITDADNDSVRITASADENAIGKSFTLRVTEPGRSITKDITFEIVGWF